MINKLKATFILTLLAIGILIINSCTSNGTQTAGRSNPGNQSVYDRVMKNQEIRVGYVIYEPGCLKNANTGELYGIGVDTLNLVAKNLGLKASWTEEVGWGTMIEGLETNRYDIVGTCVWTNANRAKRADFCKPLFFSPIFIYVKDGDNRFSAKNLESLNSPEYSIATIDGETAEIIAREDFPKAKTVSHPQLTDLSQALLAVSTGKADVSFVEPASAAGYIKNNPGKVKRLDTEPIRIFPNCWMIRRGQMEFKNMLNASLEQVINSGAVDKIIQKYEPTPNSLYRVAKPYRSPQ